MRCTRRGCISRMACIGVQTVVKRCLWSKSSTVKPGSAAPGAGRRYTRLSRGLAACLWFASKNVQMEHGVIGREKSKHRRIFVGWIKVTPDTMPTPMQRVLVTIEDKYGYRFLGSDFRFVSLMPRWERLISLDGRWITFNGNITHWMPYPEPAED